MNILNPLQKIVTPQKYQYSPTIMIVAVIFNLAITQVYKYWKIITVLCNGQNDSILNYNVRYHPPPTAPPSLYLHFNKYDVS